MKTRPFGISRRGNVALAAAVLACTLGVAPPPPKPVQIPAVSLSATGYSRGIETGLQATGYGRHLTAALSATGFSRQITTTLTVQGRLPQQPHKVGL